MLTKTKTPAEPKCSFHPAKAARWTIPWPTDGARTLTSLLCNDCWGFVASQSRQLALTARHIGQL